MAYMRSKIDNAPNVNNRDNHGHKANSICLAFREYIENLDEKRIKSMFTTLLTTYVKMVPEDFDGALATIQRYRSEGKLYNS